MKYLIFTLALISAFFVSNVRANYNPDTLKDPKSTPYYEYECNTGNTNNPTIITEINSLSVCQSIWLPLVIQSADSKISSGFWSSYSNVKFDTANKWSLDYVACRYGDCGTFGAESGTKTSSGQYNGVLLSTDWKHECPPDGYPKHTLTVPKNPQPTEPSAPPMFCAEPLDGTDPDPEPDDDSCDEFGDNSFLPPKSGLDVPDGGSVCYTTSTGKQCKYSKNDFGDGYTQTGQQCSGEEPPYGEPQTPDGNDCAVVGSLEFFAVCPVDPNEACNPLLVNNETVYQCPTGCGSVNGEYVCVHEDKNANGIPDKDEEPDNPDPDNPDPDNPDPDKPNPNPVDMAQTNSLLVGLQAKTDRSNAELSTISGKISDLGSKINTTNNLLSSVDLNTGKTANNTALTASNTDAIAGNTKGILEALEPSKIPSTFNPDSSSSFYESSYENGFEGVWEEKSLAFKQTETVKFIEQFKFDSGGEAPETQICFDLGRKMDFGCADLPIASPQLLAIIKIFILITAAFLCRALIFGG